MKDDTDWQAVLTQAEAQLEANPATADASRARAQAIGALEGSARGLELMAAHLEKHSHDARAWDLQCAYLVNLGRFDQAKAAGLRAIRLDPENGIYHYNLACALAVAGEINSALDSLRIAIDCDEDLRAFAREDESFDTIRDQERFKALIER